HVAGVVLKIKSSLTLIVCCCLVLLTPDQARTLADAGVDRINHNLNTSRRHYPEICSTHTYDERMETLRVIRDSGMELCSGGIVGMGEIDADIVEMALTLRDLNVESIPVNFLHAIDGTPLEKRHDLNPRHCLRVLCLFRLSNPRSEIRVAGGREVNLRWMQPQALYAANSLFVSDYLTTKGQLPEEDYRMIEDLGFTVMRPGPETAKGMAAHHEHANCEQDACHAEGSK
ncbi:MAG: biotin synthase BioB, partial [Planctomycetales bacterium]|nr:biotin synthase BioB [Planctomycetales bacterium]